MKISEIDYEIINLSKASGCYIPPRLTYTNSTLCRHNVFTCFVWIWEQAAIISLQSTNWLVFI